MVILLWIMGLGVPCFVGGLIAANAQLSVIRAVLYPIQDLARRVTDTEAKVGAVQVDFAAIKSRLEFEVRK